MTVFEYDKTGVPPEGVERLLVLFGSIKGNGDTGDPGCRHGQAGIHHGEMLSCFSFNSCFNAL